MGVYQRDLTRSVLKISGVINCFYLLETLHFCLVHEHVYDTRCLAKFDQVHPQKALRSAVVIGGWGINMLSIVPKAYPYTEIGI